jgi:hypothetical protein
MITDSNKQWQAGHLDSLYTRAFKIELAGGFQSLMVGRKYKC